MASMKRLLPMRADTMCKPPMERIRTSLPPATVTSPSMLLLMLSSVMLPLEPALNWLTPCPLPPLRLLVRVMLDRSMPPRLPLKRTSLLLTLTTAPCTLTRALVRADWICASVAS